MNVPLLVGDRLGAHELDVVFVVRSHVNDGIGLRPECVGIHVVGLDDHVDDSSVAVVVVEHQRDVPLLALCTAGLRGEVGLTERHRWGRLCGVSGDAGCKGATVPAGGAVDDPVGLERFGGRGRVVEGQGGVALHVDELVLAGARVNAGHRVIDLQIQAVAQSSEALGVGTDLVLEKVAKQRERGAVCSLGVGGDVDG